MIRYLIFLGYICANVLFAEPKNPENTPSKIYAVAPDGPPPVTQESIELAMELFQIKGPDDIKGPYLDRTIEDRGLTSYYPEEIIVTIGPAAFESWAMLGSTLAHELEVHCYQNIKLIKLRDLIGLPGTRDAEREAYLYELENMDRFKLSAAEIKSIVSVLNYYYALNSEPN